MNLISITNKITKLTKNTKILWNKKINFKVFKIQKMKKKMIK